MAALCVYSEHTHTHTHTQNYHCRVNSYEFYHEVAAVNGSDTTFAPAGISPKKGTQLSCSAD
jgi:hypothetical protein